MKKYNILEAIWNEIVSTRKNVWELNSQTSYKNEDKLSSQVASLEERLQKLNDEYVKILDSLS